MCSERGPMAHQTCRVFYTQASLDCVKYSHCDFTACIYFMCLLLYKIMTSATQTHICSSGWGAGGPLAVFGRVAVMQIYSGHRVAFHTNLLSRNAIQIYCGEMPYKSTLEKCHTNLLGRSRRLTVDTLSTSCFYSSASSYLSFSIPINTCSHANLL